MIIPFFNSTHMSLFYYYNIVLSHAKRYVYIGTKKIRYTYNQELKTKVFHSFPLFFSLFLSLFPSLYFLLFAFSLSIENFDRKFIISDLKQFFFSTSLARSFACSVTCLRLPGRSDRVHEPNSVLRHAPARGKQAIRALQSLASGQRTAKVPIVIPFRLTRFCVQCDWQMRPPVAPADPIVLRRTIILIAPLLAIQCTSSGCCR